MALRYMRDQAPFSYILNIKPFSELIKMDLDEYVSSAFEAGGYKWRLRFFYKGNYWDGRVTDHVSMYVRLVYDHSFPPSKEVTVELKLFIKNQRDNKFLTVQDHDVKRFSIRTRDWGFVKMLPLSTFNDSRNGYLVNDSCIIGADVLVANDKQENLTFLRNPPARNFIWKISKFSKLERNNYESDEFLVGEKKWKLAIHPKRYGDSLGFGICYVGPLEDKDKAEIRLDTRLRLLDQNNSRHFERQYVVNFQPVGNEGAYWTNVMTLKELNDPSRGFLVNDKLIVEVDTKFMTITDVVPI